MKLLAFDHIQIAMPAGQEAQARTFYGGVLGMDEIEKPAELAKRGGAWFQYGQVVIHLGVRLISVRRARPTRRCWWMIWMVS